MYLLCFNVFERLFLIFDASCPTHVCSVVIVGPNFQSDIKLNNQLVHMYLFVHVCYMAGGRVLY